MGYVPSHNQTNLTTTRRGSREGERERERTETRIDGDDDLHLIAEPTGAIEVPFADLVAATGGFIADNFLGAGGFRKVDYKGQLFGQETSNVEEDHIIVLPDHEDRISTLPDDVLSSIISRLTFRDSVKTSILSSKWRYLCAAVSDIIFDIEVMLGPNGNTRDIPNEREIDILVEKDTYRKNKHAFVMGVNQFLNRYLGPKLHSLAVSFCFDADFTSDVDH